MQQRPAWCSSSWRAGAPEGNRNFYLTFIFQPWKIEACKSFGGQIRVDLVVVCHVTTAFASAVTVVRCVYTPYRSRSEPRAWRKNNTCKTWEQFFAKSPTTAPLHCPSCSRVSNCDGWWRVKKCNTATEEKIPVSAVFADIGGAKG